MRLLTKLIQVLDSQATRLFLGVLALAAIALLVHALTRPLEDGGPDGLKYLSLAATAAADGDIFGCGHFGHSYWAPGWTASVAFIYKAFGQNPLYIRLLLIALALGTAGLIFTFTRNLVGPGAAVVASALFLFSELVFRYTSYYQYEIFVAFFVTLAAVLLLFRDRDADTTKDRRVIWLRILLAGISLGIGGFAAPRVLVLLPLVVVCLVLQHGVKRAMAAALLFVVGILVVLLPWSIRNYRCFGEFILTTSNFGIALYVGNNAQATGGHFVPPEGERPDAPFYDTRLWAGEALDYIAAHPLQTLGRSLKKGVKFWNPHYGDQFVMLLLYIAGWVRYLRARRGWPTAPILFVLAAPFFLMALHMVFFMHVRYALPTMPFVAMVAGAGLLGWQTSGSKE